MTSLYRSAAGQDAVRGWCRAQLAAWPVPHTRRTLPVAGASTHVVEAGAGALTVVVVPGTNFGAAAMLPLLTALARRHRVVGVDLPGQPGLSDGTRVVDGLPWYGAWLTALVETATTGPVVVLGHSFGSAITLAAAGGPRLAGQVLVAPAGICGLATPPRLLVAAAAWALLPRPWSSRLLVGAMLGPGHRPPAGLVDWMALVGRHCRSTGSPDRTERAARCPLVVATGEHDVFLPPARVVPAARAALGADVQVVAGSGHLVVDEDPTGVAALVDLLRVAPAT